ncbi:DHH family phosphoesterase [Rubinisphaera margarita]|uniref:DHH family phosphoesterase n=1 Tax=Rubinisphaera margarita TaxID=2909586 RepID=UPI001EE79B94|nr:bifunctional oligoribonuclease/PAP phosphatase NrnA [Rubinisphaera margarita]MCG6157380.1 bifunctional oligoribonuclease/PAP phosphatase NrnA [Rubinisphaera margarita]
MSIDWASLEDLLRNNESFVLTSHVRPDADALGSELALAGMLESWGKQVHIINPGATPAHLQFLDPESKVSALHTHPDRAELIRKCDAHIVLDTSAWIQLGEVGKVMSRSDSTKIVIDHHVSSDDLQAVEFKDTTSPATGCLVYELMTFCEYTPTMQEASSLYCAIATDTGWFRFPATNPVTMRIGGELIAAGANPAQLYNRLYEQGSVERLKLSGLALQRVSLACDDLLVYTYVTQADFAATKAHPADTENLVNECMRIKGTQAAFILVEQPNRQLKASLRSRESVDVTPVAEHFGGGGHRQASGAMLPGPIDQAIEKLVELFAVQLKLAGVEPTVQK